MKNTKKAVMEFKVAKAWSLEEGWLAPKISFGEIMEECDEEWDWDWDIQNINRHKLEVAGLAPCKEGEAYNFYLNDQPYWLKIEEDGELRIGLSINQNSQSWEFDKIIHMNVEENQLFVDGVDVYKQTLHHMEENVYPDILLIGFGDWFRAKITIQ